MKLHMEHSKDAIIKLLKFNESSKVVGCKINIHKDVHFYTLMTKHQKKGNNPIYHHIKKNKIPRHTPKEVKDM